MADLIQVEDFQSLFKNKTPLLDVRAPVEYAKGAFPTAVNLPLLNDAERQAIGLRYRQAGRDAAVEFGEELISGDVKQARIETWLAFCESNPNAVIYCFRGGLRSEIAQQWLHDSGIDVARIAGGYKALRRYLIETTLSLTNDDNLIVIGGKTGSGKTHLLNSLHNSLDLEGIAYHRGSAFGRRAAPQPAQIDFENEIAIQLLELNWEQQCRVVVEDESRAIGSLSIPHNLHLRMNESPIAMVEESLESRVDTIHLDYIQSNYLEFKAADSANAETLFADSLTAALQRIRRRLGEESYQSINALMQAALQEQRSGLGIESHRMWITELLQKYYDPMYEYQIGKKSQRIVFRGSKDELIKWIQPMIKSQDK